MKHTLPPLEAFQAVLLAASSGSLTGAAEMLDVTHGAISRRVAVVERWAGARIFSRHGRGVRQTAEGQHLIAHISHLLTQLEDIRIKRAFSRDFDVVRLGIVQSFASLWLLPNLKKLEGDPADLHLDIDIDHRFMAISNSRVAVRYGRGDWPGVSSTKLFTEYLRPVANHETAAQLGDDASISDLLLQPLLYDTTDDVWRLWLGVEALGRRPRDRAYPSYDLTLLAASLGHGIALARLPYGDHYIKELDLKFISRHSVDNPNAFHIVTSHRETTQAVDRLVLRMHKTASEHA